jgi:hypothetical protein
VTLRILLTMIGTLLAIASRASAGFRRAITRDLVIEIATDGGVAHHFVFRDRLASGRAGSAAAPDCVLRFATASQAVRTLLARHNVSHLVAGLLDGTVSIRGNPFHLLWFADLAQQIVPTAARLRWATPPGRYVAHDPTLPAAKRITREPAVSALDPAWTEAARAREKLVMMRVAAGEPAKEF